MPMDRFDRQRMLPGFGPEGQRRLSGSSIGVAGAGGLGCPALLYLAACGVGRLGIADGDVVDRSNLHRQILYGEMDIGQPKSTLAAARLQSLYPDIRVEATDSFLQEDTVLSWVSQFDLILDATDNPEIRYLLADACFALDKPLVYGAIFRDQGQVALFHLSTNRTGAHLRDVFPAGGAAAPSCSDAGVLGVLPGIIGTMQAAEAIKYLSGYGSSLLNSMVFYDMKDQSMYRVRLHSEGIPEWPKVDTKSRDTLSKGIEIPVAKWEEISAMVYESAVLVDVRNPEETAVWTYPGAMNIPWSQLRERASDLAEFNTIGFFCVSGQRSALAASMAQEIFPDKKVFSVRLERTE
jgi:sulfur-carrier protein adenylyltransferase/sulfurtransferase